MPADSPSNPSSSEEPRPDSSPQSGPPGSDVPLQGTHRGDTDDPLTSSVRGQQPPDPTPEAERVADEPEAANSDSDGEPKNEEADNDLGTYQLAHDPASGRHRMRVRPPAEEAEAPGGGFKELSRHSSPQEMSDALDGNLGDGPRFVVLENTETGDRFFDREGALSDDWFADGRFDQATVFESEDEAAAYADE